MCLLKYRPVFPFRFRDGCITMKGDSFFDEVRLRESSFCIPLFILLRDEGRVLVAVRRRVHEPLVVIGGGFSNRFELVFEKLFFEFLRFVNHQKRLQHCIRYLDTIGIFS